MVFKNKEFEKDIDDLVSTAWLMFSTTRRGAKSTDSSEESNIWYNGNNTSLLNLWNNSVKTFPLEKNHIRDIIISERLRSAIFVIKEEEFVYGGAIPYGVCSLSDGMLFAIPEGNTYADFIRICRVISYISSNIISSRFSSILTAKESSKNIVTAIIVGLVLNVVKKYPLVFDSKYFSGEAIINIANKVSDVTEECDYNIVSSIITVYINTPIIDALQYIFYENDLLNYIKVGKEPMVEDTDNTSNECYVLRNSEMKDPILGPITNDSNAVMA